MIPIKLPTLTQILKTAWQRQKTNIQTFEHIAIENPPWMRLVLENIGSLESYPIISVAHYYEQNSDLMKDPEMTFQFYPDPADPTQYVWRPLTFEMSYPPIYDVAVVIKEGKRIGYYPKLYADIRSFAQVWDRNLRAQGFHKR